MLIPNVTGGGAEFVALEWARELRRRGHFVVIILTERAAHEHSDGLPEIYSVYSRAGLIGQILKLWWLQESHRVDVVLSLMPYWNLLSIVTAHVRPRAKRPALVISERTLVVAFKRTKGRAYSAKILLARLLYRRADACIAISHAVAAEVTSLFGVPLSRIWVVPNPALAKTVSSRPLAVQPAKRQDRVAALVVPCRLIAQKRPELAIEVAIDLTAHGHPVSVHYFGSGPMEAELLARGRSAQIEVVLHGWVDDWFANVPAAPVVLLPSIVEGFGNVLVEAAASGIPCVASSRALGVSDAMVNGLSGVLTPGESIQELSAAVLAASRLPMQTLAPWLANFSILNSVDALENGPLRALGPSAEDTASGVDSLTKWYRLNYNASRDGRKLVSTNRKNQHSKRERTVE